MFGLGVNGKADTAKIVDIALVPGVSVTIVVTHLFEFENIVPDADIVVVTVNPDNKILFVDR
jgi:hypothetical protein